MNKISISFAVFLFSAFIIFAQNTENINYEKAFSAYNSKQYTNSYNMFKRLSENKKDILSDYTLYYYGRSAMALKNYAEAKNIFSRVIKEYPKSLLVSYSKQYFELSSFVINNFPAAIFFSGKEQDWIKKFVGINAMALARDMGYTNEAKIIANELIKKYKSPEAAFYYHTYHKKEITNADFIANIAAIFYNAGENNNSLIYYQMLAKNNAYKEDSAYYSAKIHEKKKQRTAAINLYKTYLANKNYQKYRRDSEFSIAEQYNAQKKYEEANKEYISFIKKYPTNNTYLSGVYHRVAINYLRMDDISKAKPYIEILHKSYKNESVTDTTLRNYMRKSFTLKNTNEAANAVVMLQSIYTGNRRDYGLSWGRWTYLKFGNKNAALSNVAATLLISKNPHYILEAYTLATDEMKKIVARSNEIYFNEAKKFYNAKNAAKSYEMLNKIQFNDAIVTGKETSFLKEVRNLAKTIMLEKQFVKDFYGRKNEATLRKELSSQTGGRSEKAIALFENKDYANAVNEMEAIGKTMKMTYPLFYFFEKIYLASDNEYKFFQMSYRIGNYFDYPYRSNVELLPDEMQKYVYPKYFDKFVVPEAAFYKIDPAYVYAVMREESTFRHYVLSRAGAYGLMQLMPATANMENAKKRYNYKPLILTDKKQNINLGISHIKSLLGDSTNYMLISAKYNAGSRNANNWVNAYGTNDMYYYSRLVGFHETEYYIERVMRSYHFYKRFYNK